jgi:hypothetical protein
VCAAPLPTTAGQLPELVTRRRPVERDFWLALLGVGLGLLCSRGALDRWPELKAIAEAVGATAGWAAWRLAAGANRSMAGQRKGLGEGRSGPRGPGTASGG